MPPNMFSHGKTSIRNFSNPRKCQIRLMFQDNAEVTCNMQCQNLMYPD